jgi:hypothetical protein
LYHSSIRPNGFNEIVWLGVLEVGGTADWARAEAEHNAVMTTARDSV